MNRIRVVLVRPQGAENVGATARAMKNMGLRQLVLVAPAFHNEFLARAMSVHACDVFDAARVVDSLLDAVADCQLVVGTTCREGPYRAGAKTPDVLAPLIVERAVSGSVALVFGPEDHGLSNEDLKLCHQLITIDTDPAYNSLNLAQAVLVCAYEIRRAWSPGRAGEELDLADSAAIEFAYERLKDAFLRIGFLHRDNPDHIMFALRRIFGRTGLEKRDVKILLGLARQIGWYSRNPAPPGEEG